MQGMKTHLNMFDQENYDYLELATVIVREMPRGQPFWATETTPSWSSGASLNTEEFSIRNSELEEFWRLADLGEISLPPLTALFAKFIKQVELLFG